MIWPQIHKFQYRNTRNKKKQANMTPSEFNNPIVMDTKESKEDESTKNSKE
jgi:hypothetical protein